jgi:hypothetical protein
MADLCPTGKTNLKLSSEDCPKEKFVKKNRKSSNRFFIFLRYEFYLTPNPLPWFPDAR